MVRPGIRKITSACLAALLLLPGESGSAEKKKTKADIANEKALADAQAQVDKAFDAWQDTAQWRAVTPEELAMTSETRAPGASAVYLYTETDRNNFQRGELNYRQIKILTEEGRNVANVSLNYNERTDKIRRIDSRVIQPDGTIVPFNGEVYDRPVDSSGQQPMRAKSFTLPDVRVGSIIEVRYWRMFQNVVQVRSFTMPTGDGGSVQIELPQAVQATAPPRWMLNQQLYTRHAKYSLQLLNRQFVRWSLPTALPAGTSEPKVEANNIVRMEVRNMPAFVTEDYMPPADDLVLSVDFSFDRLEAGDISNPAKYWKSFGEDHSKAIEEFLGNPKYVSRRLDKILEKGDSTEQKLKKIYERVRRMGNTDIPGSMDEATRVKCSRNHEHVWDVAEAGCGNTGELQLYFVALCRSAGLPAAPVRISTRQQRFFTPETTDASRLNNWLVAVTIDGRETMLSPGVPFLPFGSLVWWDTAVPAFKPDQNGGTWLTSTIPGPADAITRRKARLNLTEDGVLEGTVVVRHTGHEATGRVIALLQADEQTRIDVLKEDLRLALAVPAEITVLRQPDWHAADGVLETEYKVKVQQWAVTSGDRLMIGIGLFGNEQVGKFVAPKREHPIYFKYPFTSEDELDITLPAGFKLQNSPARQVSPDAALKYVTSVESSANVVSIHRSLTHNLLLAKQNQYPRVKSFYELVRSGDQEQIVLTR